MVRVKRDVAVAGMRSRHASPASAGPGIVVDRDTRDACPGMTLARFRGVSGVRVFVQLKIDRMRRRNQARVPVSQGW